MLTRYVLAAVTAATFAATASTVSAQCPTYGQSYSQAGYGWSTPYAGQSAWGSQYAAPAYSQGYYGQQAGYGSYGQAQYGGQYMQQPYAQQAWAQGNQQYAAPMNVSNRGEAAAYRADTRARVQQRVGTSARARSAQAYQTASQYGQQAYGYGQGYANQAGNYAQNAYGNVDASTYGQVGASGYGSADYGASAAGNISY